MNEHVPSDPIVKDRFVRPASQVVRDGKREPVVKKDTFVKKVWYGAAKFAESQSPEAWGKRIVKVIDTRIAPKLSLEKQLQYIQLRPKVVEAAALAGVGITTAEIVGAVVLGAKAIELGKYQFELARARRSLQYVSGGPDRQRFPQFPASRDMIHMPDMPVTRATSRTYKLSPEIQEQMYRFYGQEGRETHELHRNLVRKWRELQKPAAVSRSRFRVREHAVKNLRMEVNATREIRKRVPLHSELANGFMRRRINGTLITLADMMEDQTYRQLVDHALTQSQGNAVSPEFRAIFEHAHRVATERFGWERKASDSKRVWSFWNTVFDREGLDLFRDRAKRFVRPVTRLPDVQLSEMLKRVEHIPTEYVNFIPSDWQVWTDAATSGRVLPPETVTSRNFQTREVVTTTGSFLDRMRANRVLGQYLELQTPPPPRTQEEIYTEVSRGMTRALRDRWAARDRNTRMLRTAARFMPEISWNNPAIAAKFRRIADLPHVVPEQEMERVALLVDKAWQMRDHPEIHRLVIGLRDARDGNRRGEMKVLAAQLLNYAGRSDKRLRESLHLTGEYYRDQEALRGLADQWIDAFRGIGITDLAEPKPRAPGFRRIIDAVRKRIGLFPGPRGKA